jgi:hypothetical protein
VAVLEDFHYAFGHNTSSFVNRDLNQILVKIELGHQLLLRVVVDDAPCDDHDGATPKIHTAEFQGEETHHDDEVKDQVKDHERCDVFAYLATALVDLEVHKDQVVFVHLILDGEEDEGEEGYDWDKGAEQQAVEEDDKDVALMVAEIELIIVLEGCPKSTILLPRLVYRLHDPNL